MATTIQSRNAWLFDDSGYYCYVMVNGTEQFYKNVLATLRENKVQVLRKGKSYRPASNGTQYEWYIRVSYISREQIREIPSLLIKRKEPALPGRLSAPAAGDTRSGQKLAKDAKSRAIATAKVDTDFKGKLEQSQKDLQSTERELLRLKGQWVLAQQEIQSLHAQVKQAQEDRETELENLGTRLARARTEMEHLHQGSVVPGRRECERKGKRT